MNQLGSRLKSMGGSAKVKPLHFSGVDLSLIVLIENSISLGGCALVQ